MRRTGQIRILVVDDDESVRRWICAALKRHGYAVVQADGGEEALRALAENRRVDVMLTDVRMPGMDGLELGRRAHAEHPEVRIVYMTGFSDELIDPSTPLLHKPFTTDALQKELDRSIGQDDPPEPKDS